MSLIDRQTDVIPLSFQMFGSRVTDVVVATYRLNDVALILEQALPHLRFKRVDFERQSAFHKLRDEDVRQLETAEILITDNPVIPQVVGRLPRLVWIQGTFAGIENVLSDMRAGDQKRDMELPVISRFSGEKYGQLMFEYAVSFMIGNERGFMRHMQLQSSRDWDACKSQSSLSFRTLNELTVSILGLGAIGSSVARLFKQIGCRVKAFSRTQKTEEMLSKSGVDFFSVRMEDVLRDTDYVISILPHSVQTTGILDKELHNCNNSPVLMNLGRGSAISEKALLSAIDKGFISSAVLDVFEIEPLPPDSPLWTHPRVFITPHVAAETRVQDLAGLFLENYQLFIEHKDLKFQVDLTTDY